MKTNIPLGLEHAIEGRMAPDIRFAFQFFAAHWRRVNRSWSYPEHTHSMFELNLVLAGEQRMTVEGQPHIQREGDILFIRPGVVHCSDGPASGSEMDYFCLHFDVDDLTLRRSLLALPAVAIRAGCAPGRSDVAAAAEDALRAALGGIAESAKRERTGSPQERLADLSASLRFLAALGEWALAAEETLPRQGQPAAAADNAAARLAAEIERQLQRLVSQGDAEDGGPGGEHERGGIERIAARLGYSAAHCNRVFRQTYGMPPRQYLSSLIIREAKLLLMDPALTVEQVAGKLGYRDVSQFSKQFKRWTNVSPMGFRRLSHG